MVSELTSAERVKLAYAGEEPDRVPILFRAAGPWEARWSGDYERARGLLQAGADAIMHLGVSWRTHPDVTTELWREDASPYPILHKLYHTPAGDLHASVQVTPDWQVNDIPLYSDHAWPRGVDYLVKGEQDLQALGYVLGDPSESDLSAFRERAEQVREQADELGVVVQGNMTPAPLYAMGFLGGQRCLTGVRDEPELLAAVLAMVHERTTRLLEVVLDAPVDVVYRSNCYETVDLFAPSDVRGHFMPLLEADVRLCHQAGVPIHCFAQTGLMPFLEDYARLSVDIISSLDPVGPNAMDLEATKRLIGDRCCLMGGMDNRDPFLRGTPEQMERLVIETLRLLAPGGGYILSLAGMLFPEAREENITAFIEAARRYGHYPLELP